MAHQKITIENVLVFYPRIILPIECVPLKLCNRHKVFAVVCFFFFSFHPPSLAVPFAVCKMGTEVNSHKKYDEKQIHGSDAKNAKVTEYA